MAFPGDWAQGRACGAVTARQFLGQVWALGEHEPGWGRADPSPWIISVADSNRWSRVTEIKGREEKREKEPE